ncbi:MAG: hypothetical protein ACQEWV_24250 [Bacillota bacterium]
MSWSVIIGFIGGLSVSIFTIVGNIIYKHFEYKQAFRLSIIENAYKEYEIREDK